MEVGAKELIFIERSGLLFGFIFGCLQTCVWYFYQEDWVLPVGGLVVRSGHPRYDNEDLLYVNENPRSDCENVQYRSEYSRQDNYDSRYDHGCEDRQIILSGLAFIWWGCRR